MESSEIAIYRGLGEVRNYGIAVLLGLFVLNGATLGALNWIEISELRNELVKYAETIPAPDVNNPEQTINLPEEIIALRVQTNDRVGFYETSIGGQDYLAYADANKHYVLMKSEGNIKEETLSFAIALGALYFGEVILLLGWWFFVRAKIREIYETI